ncbi:hypothetical protein BGX38DRAFT_1328048 [Terfezia claveryi]|nr:hypothetical protein BGX38DRAFT_1328048 [Terfezia claveryi]
MSRRVTRSQQRKQDLEVERVREAGARIGDASSINGDGSFSGSSVNGVESVEGTPRKGRSTKRQKLAAVAVVVQKAPEEKAAKFDGGVSENEESKVQEEGVGPRVKEGKIEEKNDKQKEKEEKTENKTLNGVVKGAHKKFSEGEEEPMRGVVETVVEEVEKPVEVNGDDATNTNKGSSEDQSDDDDDAPEAVSISTGRQAIFAHEEEIKKAREQYDPLLIHIYSGSTNPTPHRQESQARLKRKIHDARLKDQKAASQFQPPPSKRQKLSAPPPLPHAQSTDTSSGPTNTAAIATATTTATPSAEPPSPGGHLSPTSSTTLSLQQPPTDPSHPLNLILGRRSSDSAPPRTYTKKLPLLLPPSLLNEVALLPPTSPSTASTKASTTKPLNTRKTLAHFEAEEKAALEAIEKKKSRQLQKLPAYKKGPVHVAVLGKEELRERDRRVMAPPGSKKVADVRDNWLMGRKLVGGRGGRCQECWGRGL